ncbi:MAG: transposase [Thermoplasmata archaeon]
MGRTLELLSERISERPPPYSVRPPHTRGRPPTDPRGLVRFLLLRALTGWSFDTTHAMLAALPELAHRLRFRRVPAASTIAQLVEKVPLSYFEALLRETGADRLQGSVAHVAGDATGIGQHRHERWIDLRNFRPGHRHRFVKLHALVVTRARWPFFVAATVTPGNVNESPAFPTLFGQLDPSLSLGNVALDKGYQSRAIAQAIADRGGRPVIALQDRVTSWALGHPAWHRMVREARDDRRRYRGRYRRRAVIEGTFGAFKFRLGETVRSRKPHAQAVEILGRTVVWNLLGLAYSGR